MTKKIWIVFITIIILLIPASLYELWYLPNYSGDAYYTYIGKSYKEIIEKDSSGNDYHEFDYKQAGYDKNGNEKLLKFDSALGRPIKNDNFLEVTFNQKHQQVISWKKVPKESIPRSPLEKILKQK